MRPLPPFNFLFSENQKMSKTLSLLTFGKKMNRQIFSGSKVNLISLCKLERLRIH